MNPKVRRITETAVLLAMLICMQWIGSGIPNPLVKQLITGTCVNCVLAVSAFYTGYSSSLTIALISPVIAFLLNISQPITVIPIMIGNACYVVLLRSVAGKTGRPFWRQPIALAIAALVKFGVLYFLVVQVVCALATDLFMGKKVLDEVLLAAPMLQPDKLPLMFSWPQLVTAVCGGALAIAIVPVLRKALKTRD